MKRDRPWMIHFAMKWKKVWSHNRIFKMTGATETRITKTTWTLCLLCPFETWWMSLEVSAFSWVYSWLCHLQGVLSWHYEIRSSEERNLEASSFSRFWYVQGRVEKTHHWSFPVVGDWSRVLNMTHKESWDEIRFNSWIPWKKMHKKKCLNPLQPIGSAQPLVIGQSVQQSIKYDGNSCPELQTICHLNQKMCGDFCSSSISMGCPPFFFVQGSEPGAHGASTRVPGAWNAVCWYFWWDCCFED